MKNKIKYILQSILGFKRYLYVFSLFKIKTLHWDKKERDFFVFLSQLKQDGGAIMDVGANIGIMSVHLGQQFPNSRIIAIEPMPANISILKKVVKKYGLKNVKIQPFAVGKKEGHVEMIMPHDGKTKMQGLSHVKCDEITEWNEGDEVKVELTLLDNLCGKHHVQGIKMDVENYEYPALLGAKNILTNHRPVLYLELWDNENRTQCFHYLSELKYQAMVVSKGALIDYNPTVHRQQNFIFVPN
jgi:FkbM family methyltransferase